jgi:Cu/Ag efflux protein CusF
MKVIAYFSILFALATIARPAFAQSQNMDNMPGMNMTGMNTPGMQSMSGMHMMSATVTAIDSSTGLTDVDTGSMKLRVHFPSASLAGIKAGDKISLHLAFTKP